VRSGDAKLRIRAAEHSDRPALSEASNRPKCEVAADGRLDRHLKTGHASTGQNRPPGSGASRRSCSYRVRSVLSKPLGGSGRREEKKPPASVRRVPHPLTDEALDASPRALPAEVELDRIP
jgi:hypothetical protein